MTSQRKKIRADRLLVELGLTESREQGARQIMAGEVLRIKEHREKKAEDRHARRGPRKG